MINSIKTELKIWFHTGRIFYFLVFTIGIFVCYAFASISTMKAYYDGFEFSREFISDEEAMWQILSEPIGKDGNISALLNGKMQIESILASLMPRNAFGFCEEVGIYLFPLLMTIIGAVTICNDYDSDIVRVRVARTGKWKYILAKQLVMFTLSIAVTFLSMLIFRAISGSIYRKAAGIVTSKFIETSPAEVVATSNGVVRVLFFILCMVIFLEFGFCIGYVFKHSVIPIGIAGFLWYLNMLPTRYEPKNAIYNLATRIYSYLGAVPNGIVAEIPLYYAILITALMLLLPMLTFILVWEKRSAFKK